MVVLMTSPGPPEDWASKKISMAQGYLTTFHTQPITGQSTTHRELTLSNGSSFCLYVIDRWVPGICLLGRN